MDYQIADAIRCLANSTAGSPGVVEYQGPGEEGL